MRRRLRADFGQPDGLPERDGPSKCVRVQQREAQFFDEFYSGTLPWKVKKVLRLPGIRLEGKRALICGCGNGSEAVQAALGGARVFGFDISPVAAATTSRLSAFNGVPVSVQVMDFAALGYREAAFDVIFGYSVLHHVDCCKAACEIRRCLKPGGVAFFYENSDRNPLLRFIRRFLFGVPGGYQRQRRLLFRRLGTTDEYPLTEEAVAQLRSAFGGRLTRVYESFVFFELLSTFGWRNRSFGKLLRTLDRAVFLLAPPLRPYSFWQGLRMERDGCEKRDGQVERD